MLHDTSPVRSRRLRIAGIFLLILLVSISIPVNQAHANSAPPPGIIWLTFETSSGDDFTPEGIQITGCATQNCTDPQLLLQFGQCDVPGCLTGKQQLVESPKDVYLTFDCAGNRCRTTAFDYGYPYFGLVVQAQDTARVIPAEHPLPQDYGETLEWLVTVTDQSGVIQAINRIPEDTTPAKPFWLYLGLTLVTELAIGCLYFWLAAKEKGRALWLRLLMITVVNLITFPVVWYFFPAMAQFTPSYERLTGCLILALSLGYSIFVWFIYHSQSQRRRSVLIVISLVLLPISISCLGLVAFAFGYGAAYLVYAQGLPVIITIVLSELYAFLWEGALYYLYSSKKLSIPSALLGSFLMNLASFLIGLLPAWIL